MSFFDVPEIIWFKPTAQHLQNPSEIPAPVPEIRGVVSNLWYSNHGGRNDERVLVVNWKTRVSQKIFMTSRAYPIWAMPFLDMGTGGQIIGQFTMPNQSEALARICNSRWTEFLYFAEESATAVAGYAPYLQTAPGVTGCVFGPSCADQWNNHNSVVIIGWDVEDPYHTTNETYHYLASLSVKKELRSLTYIPY